MIFSVTAKKLISYDSSNSDGKLWKHFDAFLQGLLAFPLYIPGTAFYKCMQVILIYIFVFHKQHVRTGTVD